MAGINYLWSNRIRFPIGSKRYFKAWAKRILSFPEHLKRSMRRTKLVYKVAKISETAEFGLLQADGNKNNLSIGDFTFIGRVYITLHDKVEIGAKVCINDGVEILTASHDVSDTKWRHVKKKIIIDDYAWIGTGAMLLPGVHIGQGAVVGARAVVTKSVPAYGIVVGNPAHLISKKRITDLDYNPCEFLASNRAWLLG